MQVGGREAGKIGKGKHVAVHDAAELDHALRRVDQRALAVERDQERRLAQGAPGRAALLQDFLQGFCRVMNPPIANVVPVSHFTTSAP